MVVERSKLQEAISAALNGRTDDAAIKLLEDVSDTLDDYESKIGDDWKTKYEENDKAWRIRYTERFNGTASDEDLENGEMSHTEVQETKDSNNITFDDLFK